MGILSSRCPWKSQQYALNESGLTINFMKRYENNVNFKKRINILSHCQIYHATKYLTCPCFTSIGFTLQRLHKHAAHHLNSRIVLIPSSQHDVLSATQAINEVMDGDQDVHVIEMRDNHGIDWPIGVSGKPLH